MNKFPKKPPLTTSLFMWVLLCTSGIASADGLEVKVPERSKEQFGTSSGYYLLPMPYSLPGHGSGIAVGGAALNMIGEETDVFGFIIDGDIAGAGLAVTDIPLQRHSLYLDFTSEYLSVVTARNYQGRGFDSDPERYSIIGIEDLLFGGLRLTSTHFDRRLEFYGAGYLQQGTLADIRDSDNNIIQRSDASFGPNRWLQLGVRVDLTDDFYDPVRGVRLESTVGRLLNRESGSIDQYIINHNLSAYVPMGKQSTWLFNFFISDAVVQSQGDTDRASIMADLGINCDLIANASDKSDCNDYVNNTIAANRYGTAEGLGGRSRLRSYPQGRFSAAHVQFLGTEFRWNLTEEFTPFDWGIMKDIRTQIQAAFFYEVGTMAEVRNQLWTDYRVSYGAGMRMVTASGLVIRGDVAKGSEGSEVTIIIGYPWEGF